MFNLTKAIFSHTCLGVTLAFDQCRLMFNNSCLHSLSVHRSKHSFVLLYCLFQSCKQELFQFITFFYCSQNEIVVKKSQSMFSSSSISFNPARGCVSASICCRFSLTFSSCSTSIFFSSNDFSLRTSLSFFWSVFVSYTAIYKKKN